LQNKWRKSPKFAKTIGENCLIAKFRKTNVEIAEICKTIGENRPKKLIITLTAGRRQ
jgi:hypothetical protein